MKLLRIAAALGVAAWVNKKFGAQLFGRAKSAGKRAGLNAPELHVRVRHPRGTHDSAASAASGAYRDDRDVSSVGALRDDGVAGS